MDKMTLSVGNKIEMVQISERLSGEEEKGRRYVSQILEFDEENEAVISAAMPIYEGKLIPLEIGTKYNVYFYTRKGLFTCTAVVLNRDKKDNIYTMQLELTSDLKKFQRRQYYRLEGSFQVYYKVFNQDEYDYYERTRKLAESLERAAYTNGVTLDVSGGGTRFLSKEKLQRGDRCHIVIYFNDEEEKKEPFSFVATIVSSVMTKNKPGVYEQRVEFEHQSERHRERFIKSIFEIERRMRQKERS